MRNLKPARKKQKNYFQNFFVNHPTSQKDRSQICWTRALGCLQEQDFLNAVICCDEGYRLSLPCFDKDKIENHFNKLIDTYKHNESLLYIEFARLEEGLTTYLLQQGRHDDLYHLARLGNIFAFQKFFSSFNGEGILYLKRKIKDIKSSEREEDLLLKIFYELTVDFKMGFKNALICLTRIKSDENRSLLKNIIAEAIRRQILEDQDPFKTFLTNLRQGPTWG